jgi:hypothetical protein
MYKLFTDKADTFECDVQVEGTSLKKCKARLIVETPEYSLMFKGDVDSNGKCKVPIKKLRGLINEDSKGQVRLEVIADKTFFSPWESKFEIVATRQVTVEVKSQQLGTSQQILEEEKNHVTNLLKLLILEDINIDNLKFKRNKLNKLIATYTKHKPLLPESKDRVIKGVINGLITE